MTVPWRSVEVSLGRRYLPSLNAVLVPGILLVYAIVYAIDESRYRMSLKEDQITEALTFVALVFAGVLALDIARRLWRRRDRRIWFFVLFGLGSLLAGFEEISWGQRVFGLESPTFFKEGSTTQEISAHNVIQDTFDVKTKHIAGIVLFLYGVLLPMLARSRSVRGILDRTGLVVPPGGMILSWLVAALLMFDRPTGEEEEIGELLFGICFVLFVAGEWINATEMERVEEAPSSGTGQSV